MGRGADNHPQGLLYGERRNRRSRDPAALLEASRQDLAALTERAIGREAQDSRTNATADALFGAGKRFADLMAITPTTPEIEQRCRRQLLITLAEAPHGMVSEARATEWAELTVPHLARHDDLELPARAASVAVLAEMSKWDSHEKLVPQVRAVLGDDRVHWAAPPQLYHEPDDGIVHVVVDPIRAKTACGQTRKTGFPCPGLDATVSCSQCRQQRKASFKDGPKSKKWKSMTAYSLLDGLPVTTEVMVAEQLDHADDLSWKEVQDHVLDRLTDSLVDSAAGHLAFTHTRAAAAEGEAAANLRGPMHAIFNDLAAQADAGVENPMPNMTPIAMIINRYLQR